jgi:hypothetical protein
LIINKSISYRACLLTCLFFVQPATAKILKDDKYITGQSEFSFSEACKYLTKRDSPLIEVANISTLNCMGKKTEIGRFCDHKEAANPYYIRGIVDTKNQKVICLSSKRVIIKYECEGVEDQFCKDAEIGCFLLKEKLARRLKISHQSITNIDSPSKKKALNCYFDIGKNSLDMNL